MSDLRGPLNRKAGEITSQEDALEGIRRRASELHLRRRVMAGLVALALASGGIAVSIGAFSADPGTRPAAGPTTLPSPGSSYVPLTLYVENRSGVAGLADQATTLAGGHSTDPVYFSVVYSHDAQRTSGDSRSEVMYSAPGRDAALGIRDQWLPGAPLRFGAPTGILLEQPMPGFGITGDSQKTPPRVEGGIPPDVTIIIGDDFRSYPIAGGLEAARFLSDFTKARLDGMGAEPFLSNDVEARYRNHETGLQLYEYGPGQEIIVTALRASQGGYEAAIEVLTGDPTGENSFLYEHLRLGPGPSGDFVITFAERTAAGSETNELEPVPGPTPPSADSAYRKFTLETFNATGLDLDLVFPYTHTIFEASSALDRVSFSSYGDAEEGRPISMILFDDPALETTAYEIKESLLQGAQFGELPSNAQTDMQIYLGRDYGDREQPGMHAHELVRSFMAARHRDKGAEKFLTENAARKYATGEGGLSLYEYDRGTHDITAIHRHPQRSTFLVVVRIPQWPDSAPGEARSSVYETLEVGGVQDAPDIPLRIVYAERKK